MCKHKISRGIWVTIGGMNNELAICTKCNKPFIILFIK